MFTSTATTQGVKVSVKTEFQPEYSAPLSNHFIFTYSIEIQNLTPHPVRLLRRHWLVRDAYGQCEEIDGEGVVGEQPTIMPGETFRYVSGCHLQSDIGKMQGTYLMERYDNGELFPVSVPEFSLINPVRLN